MLRLPSELRSGAQLGQRLLLAVAITAVSMPIGAEELTVARYSTVRASPTLAQRDPLAAIVQFTLPPSVERVGQAVEALLASSGYRLSDEQAADPDRKHLLELPLPASHRELGPMPLRVALATLAGPAFVLIEDSAHRLVSFERCVAEPQRR